MDLRNARFTAPVTAAILASLLASPARSQSTFQKGAGGRSLITTADGGFAHCDRVYIDGNSYDLAVTRFNASMAPVWKKTYNIGGGNYEEPYVMRQAADGGYFVGGATTPGGSVFYSNVVKLEDDGDVSWHLAYSGGTVRGIHPLADSGAVIAAATNSSAQLYRISKSGAVVWGRDYTGIGVTALLRLGGGGYAVLGYASPTGNGQDMMLMRVDDTGAVIWAKAWGGTGNENVSYGLTEASDGGLVAIGSLQRPLGSTTSHSLVLVKFSLASGAVLIQKGIYEPGSINWGIQVDRAADNGYLVMTANGALIKTDAAGNPIWARGYVAGGDANYYSLKALPGGGALLQTFYVTAVTDADGHAGCTQRSVSVTAVDTSATLTTLTPTVTTLNSTTALSIVAASASLPTVPDFKVAASKTVNATGPATFCGGGGPMLTSPSTVVAWSTGETTSAIQPNQSGSFWADVVSSTGCAERSDTVVLTSLGVPPTPGPVAGKDTVCRDEAGVAYSISAVSGATSYSWSASGGAALASASTTTSAAANFSTYAGTLTVNALNTCGTSAVGRNKSVTVVAAPVQGFVTGTSLLCRGQTGVGFKAAGSGYAKSYAWTVPAGAVIRSGQGSDSITVDFGDSSGNVAVTPQNECGSPAPAALTVTLSPAVASPAAITGSGLVCARQQGVVYSIAPVNGATSYSWTPPPGATLASSNGSSSVSLNFGDSAGAIKVSALFACGASAPTSLAVSLKAATPSAGALSGPAAVCAGAAGVVYLVTAQSAFTGYDWTVPSGATKVAGTDSNALAVNFGTTAGSVTVTPKGTCGDGPASSKSVGINPLPAQPTITVQGIRLISSEGYSYKWTRVGEGTALATTREFDTPERVQYTVTVTDANGCTAISNPKNPGFPSSLARNGRTGLDLRFEGAATGLFIPLDFAGEHVLSARLMDAGGRTAWSHSAPVGAGGAASWSIGGLDRGLYTLFLDVDGRRLRTLRITRL